MGVKDIRHNAPPLPAWKIELGIELAQKMELRRSTIEQEKKEELPKNPYWTADKLLNAQDQRNRKVGQLMSRTVRKHERGFGWTMGYNNLVGRYSTEQTPTLSGSSLNRKLKPQYAKGLCNWKIDLIKVATKVSPYFAGPIGRTFPLFTYALWPNPETERRYRDWLREMEEGSTFPISLPIYVLSDRSRGKIRDKATAFFRSCPGQRVFATLTFVSKCDDAKGVSILNKFLTEARKKFPGLQYLWVAERQNENWKYPGNIHFHIILNKRMPVGRWNAFWTLTQYNAGLIGEDKYGRPISKKEITEAYALDVKEGFKNKRIQSLLNPFDIRKIHSITKLSWYLTKYITKQDKGARFACLPWHCSRRVSRMFTRALVSPSAFRYMKSFANYAVDKKTGECWEPVMQQGPFWVVIYSANKQAPLRYMKELEQVNKWIGEGLEIDRLRVIDDDIYRTLFISKDP